MKLKLLFSLICAVTLCNAQQRKEVFLRNDWAFSRDGRNWENVTVPHDWAISGPFDKKWDLQMVAIKENGEEHPTEHTGRSGSLPWIGEGQYVTHFSVPSQYKRAELVFDGAMSEPVVYINGKEAGRWAYGYNAFRIDATPYIYKDGRENELTVKLSNLEESNRWYPGGGIYRPVKLLLTGKTCIDSWGTFIYTTKAGADEAGVAVDVQLKGYEYEKGLVADIRIMDRDGNKVADARANVDNSTGKAAACLVIRNPKLWSPESPYLYKVVTDIYKKRHLIDSYTTRTGVRTVTFSREKGFCLNGVTRKIKGVCLHHDLGPLGAELNRAALIRQIRLMKDMGADAIRTSHNMPSKWQMEICDSMGMMVMAESFDAWKEPKVRNGYNRMWDEWWRKDITNLILNHRNHPCIIMWSVGNEIPEQWKKEGAERYKNLVALCHELDPTRTVTCGMDQPDADVKSGFAQVADVPGFNYRVHRYEDNIGKLPQGFLLGSETASTVSSRGVYKFPVEPLTGKTYPDGQCSSYDMEYCWWSNLPDDDWRMQDDFPWTVGEFVWTGFDYLGEPTPYDSYWPSRSSYFGICDLAGLPKDRYYLYRSHWNRKEHTVHLLPHWTWPDRVGETTPVYCYTDYPSAELFVNGKSQGRIEKQPDTRLDRYRLRWNDVRYEPGELRVVVYDGNGNKAGERVLRTAGEPSKLQLTADRTCISADGDDISFVTVTMLDKDGNECPDADDGLLFTVSGAGKFQAACNGDATSLEPFTLPKMRLFHGKLVVLVRSSDKPGVITLNVKAPKRNIEESINIDVK